MANNTDAPPQPPSRPGYRDTEQAQLIYLLRLRVPMTLKQHIFLVAMQIKARVYEEELKMFDGPFRESFCFLAVEVVLWHYRRNPRDFPRRFEPMHDLGEFCKILSENFLPYQREFRPYQREFHFPFAQPCGVFRGGTERGTTHALSPREGQPICARIMPVAGTDGLFKFSYRNRHEQEVSYSNIAFNPNRQTELRDLTVEHREWYERFVSEENERILIMAARRRLRIMFCRLSDAEREQLGWGPEPKVVELQRRLGVPHIRWDDSIIQAVGPSIPSHIIDSDMEETGPGGLSVSSWVGQTSQTG